jgi:N-acetylglutamate synthase-like GNAT family acetyltransferase
MKIISYQSAHQKDFERLNKAWVSKYFKLEPLDEKYLSRPEEHILKKGGRILLAEHGGKIIGTVALVFIEEGVYELAKMTVDEAFRGMGAGKLLCRAAIEEAQKLKAEKLVLFTNSRLETAISIYHKSGFTTVPLQNQQYDRADVKMELQLRSPACF